MKTFLYDGMKSYDAPMNMPEAWSSLGQQKDATDSELASRVAAVFRVRDLLSNAVANVPFSIYEGETEIDNSADWQNAIGFMPNPIDLIRRWRLSLTMSNAAYGFCTKVPLTAKGANIQYLVSSSVTPQTDNYTGELTGFKRETGTMTTTYPLKSGRIIYLWKLDETTEMLPSEYTEFRAMCASAGIMHYADLWTGNYFKRGGVKPTLIGVKGAATPTAREELEKGFSAWIKRLTQPAKVINAEAMEVNAIGDGIGDLKDMSVYEQAVQSVCTAVGIPAGIVLSNFDNYATAQTYYWQFYKDKVNYDCQFIQETLNTQIFEPQGRRMEFNIEAAEPNQAEEVERASAFSTYVSAGIPLDIAAQIVGVEMPEGMDYDTLKEAEEEKKAKEEADAQQQLELQKEKLSQPTKSIEHFTPTLDQIRELNRWQVFAFRKLKKAESLDFPFRLDLTPEAVGEAIRARLVDAKTEDEIKLAFDLAPETVTPAPDYTPLIKSIELGVEALRLIHDRPETSTE